jgi:thiol-disulfide isomerase/thioredoxin
MRRTALSLVALVLLAGCTRAGQSEASTTAIRSVSEPLPALAGDAVDGAPISTKDFAGSVLVVNAWASWCTPC